MIHSVILTWQQVNFKNQKLKKKKKVGVDFKLKSQVYDNRKIKVQIWDTAGKKKKKKKILKITK